MNVTLWLDGFLADTASDDDPRIWREKMIRRLYRLHRKGK